MFNKLKFYILKNWRLFFGIAIVFPLTLNFIIFFLFDANKIVLIFILNNIYYLLIVYFYNLGKKIKKENNPRTPIKFLIQFNRTGEKLYWDEFQKHLRHLTGVEVGVYEGRNALSMYNHLNIRKLYLVDPWKEYNDYMVGHSIDDQKKHDENYSKVKKIFSGHKNVEIIRKTSEEASKNFEDNSLDFVYLDGDHSYEAVKLDLQCWYPKLNEYGVMCGDDYGHISGRAVIKAVNEFAFEKKVIITYGDDNQFWFVKTIK